MTLKKAFTVIFALFIFLVPRVKAMIFIAKDSIPCARSGFAFAYDENRGVAVLFGGQDNNSKRLGDTWEWTDGGWKQVSVSGPPARINAAIAYDPVSKRVLIFGGSADSGSQNDMWAYDGRRWVKIESATSPEVRQMATMVFDQNQSQLILFGGVDFKTKARFGDTWIMKENQWQKQDVRGPSARASQSMVYDPDADAVYLYGGYDTTTLKDFWKFKNGSWTEISLANEPLRCHTSVVYDTDQKKLLMFGGFSDEGRTNEFWEYSAGIWKQVKLDGQLPDPRAEHRGVFIPGKGYLIFGGVIGPDANTRDRGNDTWLYDGKAWLRK